MQAVSLLFQRSNKSCLLKKNKEKDKLTTTRTFLYAMRKRWLTIEECKNHMAQVIHPH
jgi:hypothetical protein